MQVKQQALGQLLVEMGVKTGDVLPVKRLQAKLDTLPKLAADEDTPDPKTEESKKLLKSLLKALKNEDDIEIIPTPKKEEEETQSEEKPSKKAAKAKAKAEEEDEEDEEEDEEDEEEDEEEEKPSKKKSKAKAEEEDDDEEEDEEDEEEDEEEEKPAKKSKKDKKKDKKKGSPIARGPGIISYIRTLMEGTSEKKRLTKQQIVDKIHEKFPDHPVEGLMKTVTGQVSYFLRDTNKKQKNPLNIQVKEHGYYVVKD